MSSNIVDDTFEGSYNQQIKRSSLNKYEEKQFIEELNNVHLHETLVNTIESLYINKEMPENYYKTQEESAEFIARILQKSKDYLFTKTGKDINSKIKNKILEVFSLNGLVCL